MHAERYNLRTLASRKYPVGTCKQKGTQFTGFGEQQRSNRHVQAERYQSRALVSSKNPDQTAQPCSLVRIFAARNWVLHIVVYLESIQVYRIRDRKGYLSVTCAELYFITHMLM